MYLVYEFPSNYSLKNFLKKSFLAASLVSEKIIRKFFI